MITVLEAGPLTTVQDRGRIGWAHLGVPRAGALDDVAADLANRLLGNRVGAAVLEVTLGGLRVRTSTGRWFAVTGAPCPVSVDGAPVAHGEPVWVPGGAEVGVGAVRGGVRAYVGVAGGVDVAPVLGSRSTDTLAWIGPPQVRAGDELPVGRPVGEPRAQETPRPPRPGALRVHPGPRADWFAADAIARLCSGPYAVSGQSNRIGLRLEGESLVRVREGELASEGMVLGAVQVPPSGLPVVFLADHPPTGGYPVVAVVETRDLWQCGQLRPGDEVRFRPARRPGATA